MFCALIYGGRSDMLSRPPWGCVATPELAIDWLGIHPQTMWNYRLRRMSPGAEPDARRLYRKVGRRIIFRYETVLSWLPGGADRSPWHWSRCWLHAIGESVADAPEAVLALIARLEETDPDVKDRPFGFRRLDTGLARLRLAYGC